ncbi:MAG: hypothetical protein ACKV2T_36635 [Kofleriaceae bacterium]
MWDELWIEREVTPRELLTAVAKAHGIHEDDIEIVDGIATEAPRQARVIVHRTRGAGEFASRIQLSGAPPDDRRVFCARLASVLGCKLLGDDGNINPFTFMMYEPGTATRVAVDQAKLEQNEPVVVGPYVPVPDDESHPTKPIRRYPKPATHRSTRGGQVAYIVNDYMVEGLPRPPMVEWAPAIDELYNQLHRLLGTVAYRAATAEEIANIKAWSAKLRGTFPDVERAGWFVVEVLEASAIVLAEPWDPDKPAIEIPRPTY